MSALQCSAADQAASAMVLVIPALVLFAAWLVWKCYGEKKWMPSILARRAAIRSNLRAFFNVGN